jgi:hypothetical protein
MKHPTKKSIAFVVVPTILALVAALGGCSATKFATDVPGTKFETPEQAVAAVAGIAGTGNEQKVAEIFGPDAVDLFDSGDEVADRQQGEETRELIAQKVAFEETDEHTLVALFGDDAWPFPIPLVRTRGGWAFDTEAGREEVRNRRIGANELSTLATLHAVVDAQREYLAGASGRRGAYARRMLSTKGKRDGLYWPTKEGQKPSPLGPLAAEAEEEGYSVTPGETPAYHGYHYRMLTEQGPHAPGGAKSYLDAKGAMTGGFAMLAWPAKYGNSGVMTFVVGDEGIVFQKDLGDEAATAVATIRAFDPDESWAPTGD